VKTHVVDHRSFAITLHKAFGTQYFRFFCHNLIFLYAKVRKIPKICLPLHIIS
jgi:hypothetical protein